MPGLIKAVKKFSGPAQLDVNCEYELEDVETGDPIGWAYIAQDDAFEGRVEHFLVNQGSNNHDGWTIGLGGQPMSPYAFVIGKTGCVINDQNFTLQNFYANHYSATRIPFQTHGHPKGPAFRQSFSTAGGKVKLTGYRLHDGQAANSWAYFRCFAKTSDKLAPVANSLTDTNGVQTIEFTIPNVNALCGSTGLVWIELFHTITNPTGTGFAIMRYRQ